MYPLDSLVTFVVDNTAGQPTDIVWRVYSYIQEDDVHDNEYTWYNVYKDGESEATAINAWHHDLTLAP